MATYTLLRSTPSAGHASAETNKISCRSWLQVCIFFCVLCTIIYIPLFYTITVREDSQDVKNQQRVDQNFTWNVNSSRDVATYVQPENVTALISNKDLCGNESGPPFLLIVVCSAVSNFRAREAIRQTWMSQDGYFNLTASLDGVGPIRTAFLLGRNLNDTWQSEVMAESQMHGDIIQEGFVDAYLNLTLKSVMLLKWVKTHCPQVTFVLKTDDDMFVNIPALVKYLTRPDVRQRTDLIVGSLFCRVQPIKDLASKWYSPKFMFSEREYPDYVSGTGYVLSGHLVPTLFDTSLKVPLFHLEDVFTTGLVARKAGITPENFHLFSYLKHPIDNPCLYRRLITSHGLTPQDLYDIWPKVTNPSLNCTGVQLPKIGEPKLTKCRRPARVAVAGRRPRAGRIG